MIFARRAGVEVVPDPAAPPAVPRPTCKGAEFIYERNQYKKIVEHITAKGWTEEHGGDGPILDHLKGKFLPIGSRTVSVLSCGTTSPSS